MDNQKPLQFNGTAGSYFVVFIVTLITTYIPIFGWAFGFNFMANWVAENSVVNGKPVVYKAGYGETLKFIFINSLLLIITLGIYIFWFTPKCYRYAADHMHYTNSGATESVAAPVPAINPTPPSVLETSPEPLPTPTPPADVTPSQQPPTTPTTPLIQ